jgi:8-oxo-dGTP pyrophosphatase MutT (NUDIX family)
MSEVYPAATVVVLRQVEGQLEVLMLRRNSKLDFAGGSWVFPGGRVDADELEGRDVDTAARLAAVRETREEAGLDISHCELQQFAHWTTPEAAPKRFATWFFITELEADNSHDVAIDGGEIHEHRWMAPGDVLAAFAAKEIEMMPPTYISLLELKQFNEPDQAIAFYRQRPPVKVTPKPAVVEQAVHMLYVGDAGYDQADPMQPGRRHRMVLDPAGWQYLCSDPSDPTGVGLTG